MRYKVMDVTWIEGSRLKNQAGIHFTLTAWELTLLEANESILFTFLVENALQTPYLGRFWSDFLEPNFIVRYTSERPNASIHVTRHSHVPSPYKISFGFAVYKLYLGQALGVLGASCAYQSQLYPITIVLIHSSRCRGIINSFACAHFESVQFHLQVE